MTALDDLRRSLAQVPGVTPVSVTVAHSGDDEVFKLDAGALAEALGVTTIPPREWAMPLGDPDGKTYPPPGWTRTNWRGARYKLNGKDAMHTGDDLDKPGETDRGEPVYAVREGEVIWAQRIPTGTWGNLLVIRHHDSAGNPFYARYGHLDAFRVMAGQKVAAGQWVGNVGHTGGESGAFGSHLHFDLTNPGDTTLETLPTHWPGLQQDIIERVYADPGSFLLAQINGTIPGRWVKVKTTSALKIRLQAGTAGPWKDVLPLGAVVEIAEYTVKANGYTWAELRDGRGYIATEYTRPFEAPPPVVGTNLRFPRLKAQRTEIGLHIIGWVQEAFQFAERMTIAGTPLAGAVVVEEEKMIAKLREVMGPNAILIFRTTAFGDSLPVTTDATAAYRLGVQRAADVLPGLMQRAPQATAYSLANEWVSRTDPVFLKAQCAAYRGMMDFANSAGGRILVADLNSGHTETERPEILAAMAPMLAQAERDGHLLNYHVYTLEHTSDLGEAKAFIAMRWPDILARDYPQLQAVVGELGFSGRNGTYAGKDALLKLARDHHDFITPRDNDRVLLAALYTLTQYDSWRQSDFLRDLEALSEAL